MIVDYIKSMASRGLTNNKVSLEVRQQRIESCHGNANFKPCQHRAFSETGRFHYCDECGCGEKKGARLSAVGSLPDSPRFDSDAYDKLDYPYLVCPIGAPGFSAQGKTMLKPTKDVPLPDGPQLYYYSFSGGINLLPQGVQVTRAIQFRKIAANKDGSSPLEIAPVLQIQLLGSADPDVVEFNNALGVLVQNLLAKKGL